MAQSDVKIELAAELERARTALGHNIGALRHDLNVGSHLKHSFHRNKAAYIGGATVFGLLLSKLPTRKKKIYVETKPKQGKRAIEEAEKAGIWLVILQALFKIFRPAITSFLTKQATELVKWRARGKR